MVAVDIEKYWLIGMSWIANVVHSRLLNSYHNRYIFYIQCNCVTVASPRDNKTTSNLYYTAIGCCFKKDEFLSTLLYVDENGPGWVWRDVF